METNLSEHCFEQLTNLYTLYKNVKRTMLLSEQFDGSRECFVETFNQLRNALDHVFTAIHHADQSIAFEYDLQNAKEHLLRAGYDAIELLAGNLGSQIIDQLECYDIDALTQVFPDYYTSVLPKISDIQFAITQKRMLRSHENDSDQSFLTYLKDVEELTSLNTAVNQKIPALQDYKKRKAKEKRRERYWNYLIGPLIGAIIGSLLTLLFKSN